MAGAYCPIHKMHVQLFHEAKAWFEDKMENSAVVVGGLLSPSHDSYVRPKLLQRGTTSLPAQHRWEMTRLACTGSDWLMASSAYFDLHKH